jgi:hypothetical protein
MRIIHALESEPRASVRRCRRGATHRRGRTPPSTCRSVTARAGVLRCSTGSGITADATRLKASGANGTTNALSSTRQPAVELLETLAFWGGHYRANTWLAWPTQRHFGS